MSNIEIIDQETSVIMPFYDQPQVQIDEIPVGPGIPLGIERVSNPELGIAGAYGAWGMSFDNQAVLEFVEQRIGHPLDEESRLNLASLGFVNRHHIPELTPQEDLELEVAVGARFVREAAYANGWEPGEVDAVLLGTTGPVADDYTERVAHEAGIPESALKVSIHKACDSSVGALHLALNPNLEFLGSIGRGLAERLAGKKVLVGGIEGLSRLLRWTRDTNALQLFGNGAGVIGMIPGRTIRFLVGKAYEAFDEKGVLALHMYYPYTGRSSAGGSMIEVTQAGQNHIRVAGFMKEPANDHDSVDMAGPMGMVKLFVRNGVGVVSDVYHTYRRRMEELGTSQKSIITTIAHHANFRINTLKSIQLEKEGIHLSIPWILSEFGNVSAASNMIAFLRKLPGLKPDDHVLFDGFGAGTYYDVLVVSIGES